MRRYLDKTTGIMAACLLLALSFTSGAVANNKSGVSYYPANSFNVGNGATLVVEEVALSGSTEDPVEATLIQLPSTSGTYPTASRIIENLARKIKPQSRVEIQIPFMTDDSALTSGDVRLQALFIVSYAVPKNADGTSKTFPNGSTSKRIDLGSVTVVGVEATPGTTLYSDRAYVGKIFFSSNKMKKILKAALEQKFNYNFVIQRVNTSSSNFSAPVYVSGVKFIYKK